MSNFRSVEYLESDAIYREYRKTHPDRRSHRRAFCVRYHDEKQRLLNAQVLPNEECEAYMRLLKRIAGIDDTRQRPPVTDSIGLNDLGKSHSRKRIKKHPAERADHAYHGGQFYNGEW
jgi:hypothetical protein